jgi:hypothetical protein
MHGIRILSLNLKVRVHVLDLDIDGNTFETVLKETGCDGVHWVQRSQVGV